MTTKEYIRKFANSLRGPAKLLHLKLMFAEWDDGCISIEFYDLDDPLPYNREPSLYNELPISPAASLDEIQDAICWMFHVLSQRATRGKVNACISTNPKS